MNNGKHATINESLHRTNCRKSEGDLENVPSQKQSNMSHFSTGMNFGVASLTSLWGGRTVLPARCICLTASLCLTTLQIHFSCLTVLSACLVCLSDCASFSSVLYGWCVANSSGKCQNPLYSKPGY